MNLKDYHINIFYNDEDQGYITYLPDLECCSVFDNTPDEALRELVIEKKAWIEAAPLLGSLKPTSNPARDNAIQCW